VITPLSGGLERGDKMPVALEDWPICTTMASVASDADWAQLDPDFKAGKKALGAEDWNGAIATLKLAALRDPLSADIQNYIGYAYRRLRQLGPAIGHYQQALTLNPRHRSAHEHLGEAYLVLGETVKAEQLLVALENLCLHSLRGIRRPQARH
jgi:Flp pilus assembly protein TadD